MKIQVITLFPEMFDGVFKTSMLWKAQKEGIVEYSCVNLRDFGIGPRKTVDDTPYGGGDGMVLMVEPLMRAVEAAKQQTADNGQKIGEDPLVLLMTPRGKIYKQSDAKRLATEGRDLILICGRYEGYDERITTIVDEQICVGNYVLTGGEIPAMTVIDSVVRLLPGVLGGETSAEIESFYDDDQTIEAPQYTRPADYNGMQVPEILLSGNHSEIEKWRLKNNILT
jgi:tRNA (guanine37-N1)-methyltransferase